MVGKPGEIYELLDQWENLFQNKDQPLYFAHLKHIILKPSLTNTHTQTHTETQTHMHTPTNTHTN